MFVILSLGTNTDYLNIEIAEQRLQGLFSAVRVSRTLVSPAVDSPSVIPDFANAIFTGDTSLSFEELRIAVKNLERAMGRDREQKGRVDIDIDILLYGTQLFKPKDWHRPYNEVLISEMGF